MADIPHPNARAPEYDAPPPRPYVPGSSGFQQGQPHAVIRPASQVVNSPNEKPRAGPLPGYAASAPLAGR